jgi:hypothetical protein
MSAREGWLGGCAGDGARHGGGAITASGAARTLSLAAAPACAILALLTAAQGGAPADVLCSSGTSPLGGMTLMYALMSVVHAAPWLKLMSGGRTRSARRPASTSPGRDAPPLP